MTTWKTLIEEEMVKNGETYADIVYANEGRNYRHAVWNNPPLGKWDEVEFNESYGGENGVPFIVYTDKWIYFPVSDDGFESVRSLPRNPNPKWQPTHFGG